MNLCTMNNENSTLTGNDLLAIGFPPGKSIGVALAVIAEHFSHDGRAAVLQLLEEVLKNADAYVSHPQLGTLAKALQPEIDPTIALRETVEAYAVFGAEGIEPGAITQMETAMRLPVSVAGALMPDAHQGYGLPIGGVLATHNSVIPYGVGVDIGCRMCMTLYDLPVSMLHEKKEPLKKMLLNNTRFGRSTFTRPMDHAVLERSEFNELNVLRTLKDRAYQQIGTSGGGNHFVEFGIVEVIQPIAEFHLQPRRYLALLSHSGSRGLGAAIAGTYTQLAMAQCKLPQEAKHLAWLNLDSEEGAEYWLAMNLAGDYASACHHQIHERMAVGLRETPLAMIENHHNFAWKEKDANGNEVIVHRKGATPAGAGTLGIIPGSMATPGFIVRGKGDVTSINSASHGAGRTMSRTKAKQTLDRNAVNDFLEKAGVVLIGSDLDEAPMAYKDIHQVMRAQQDLVEVLGTFTPKIVRMCGDEKFKEVD